ncbi:hypothetical protein EBN03_28920 [Nocardia stercoris]|uniref:Uncharacterized protein n=1 Tax=Nocardia stercoris TaxID=2483361 RepID=A0A3M2KU71_9NOCA|nr:hypothetical protein EBN03_28920 [Nocardia stercoris]
MARGRAVSVPLATSAVTATAELCTVDFPGPDRETTVIANVFGLAAFLGLLVVPLVVVRVREVRNPTQLRDGRGYAGGDSTYIGN